MDDAQERTQRVPAEARAYQPPAFDVISLDCEITAYAPDDDSLPLF